MVDVCFEVFVADVCFVFFAVAFGFELSPGSFAHVLALVKSVILLFGGCLKMRQLFCLGRRISGHGAEALFDGAFFNARLHVRLFKVKNSSKKSVLAENRLPVRVFEGKKSSIESSIVTRLQENVFRARKNSPPSKSNFKSNISGQKTWTKCWNSAKSNSASNISGLKSWTMS